MKSFRYTLAAVVSTLMLYACGSSGSSASSAPGLTQAQVQSLISAAVAPLQQQVTTLQGQVATLQSAGAAAPAVFIKAPNMPAAKVARQLSNKAGSGPTCTGLGTLTGRPTSSDPISSDDVSGVSCTGYYFTVSGAATSSDNAIVQGLQGNLPVWYDAPNCTGNAYVTVGAGSQSLSNGALANGAVFRAYLASADDPTNTASYLMLQPGTASSEPTLLSELQNGQCGAVSVTQFVVYELATNDQTVSGVPSAPIPGPVTIN